MAVKPGDTIYASFQTMSPLTGLLANADSAPTGEIRVNGVDSGETVTIAHPPSATGDYLASGPVPDDAAAGDTIEIVVTATVSSMAVTRTIRTEVVDTSRASEVASAVANVLARLNSVGVEAFTSTVDDSNIINIWKGYDWVDESAVTLTQTWTGDSLAGVTECTMRIISRSNYDVDADTGQAEFTGVLSLDGTALTCTFELAAADLTALNTVPHGGMPNYRYDVSATTGDADVVLLFSGWLRVYRETPAVPEA